MLDIFSGLRLVVKRRSISIDNAIFRCHWFFTSTLLVSFSLIITARQYVGQPIECHSVNKLPDSLLNSYCWVQSTFTVPQACNKQVGFEVPYPCIDNTRGREIKMFAYYQWVGIVLFIQGLLFHLPYYLWKVWENGLIRAITGGLRVAVLSDQERVKKKDIVVEYIHDHLGCHKRYAFKYFLCEFICLVNLVTQLWATNKFFDGQFLRYGIDVIQYSSTSLSDQFGFATIKSSENEESVSINTNNQSSNAILHSSKTLPNPFNTNNKLQEKQLQSQVDPMTYIFPRITKCTYYDFGSSGDIQKHDALCLLPLNIINEKIYIALWFWFLILAILTLLVIFYRLFAIVSENVRCKGLISRCKLSSERDIRIICRHCDVGDWFLFYMVAENLDPLIMREIIASIASKIRAHFDLKRELGMMGDNDNVEVDSMYKSKIHDEMYRAQYYEDEGISSLISSRRNSLAEDMPFVKKVKKRLYNKRLWSMELPANSLRQQLLSNSSSVDTNHRVNGSTIEEPETNIATAPPVFQMPLNSAPPLLMRRNSLKQVTSNSSCTSNPTNNCVLEMQTISGSSLELDKQTNGVMNGHLHRRLSSLGGTRPPLVRQRNLNHHNSMTSLKESNPSRSNANQLYDEIEILESA